MAFRLFKINYNFCYYKTVTDINKCLKIYIVQKQLTLCLKTFIISELESLFTINRYYNLLYRFVTNRKWNCKPQKPNPLLLSAATCGIMSIVKWWNSHNLSNLGWKKPDITKKKRIYFCPIWTYIRNIL